MKRSITEKENALRVLTHSGNPQWVPIADDCFQTIFSSEIHERPAFGKNGDDWFGCSWHWAAQNMGHAPDLKKPLLLEDVTKWRDVVKFPDIDAIDWAAAAERDLAGIDRNEKLVRFFMESGPFERSHHLMGFENVFIAMYEEPEEYKALLNAIADYKIKIIHKIAETYKPDEIFFQDDLGTANAPMISLETYRKFFKPIHKRVGEAIRSHGIFYTHHSCGNMEMFIDDLLDNGATMLNPIQRMNNREEIAKKYKGCVCINSGAERYAASPGASEEDIRGDVRKAIDVFAPGRNFIYDFFLTDVNCERNKEITLDEARKYGAVFYNSN